MVLSLVEATATGAAFVRLVASMMMLVVNEDVEVDVAKQRDENGH